jgi:hypothetical protein
MIWAGCNIHGNIINAYSVTVGIPEETSLRA